eukprot:SAG31_NODE_302_length_18087_cov_97.056982_3_plen_122_part_00
MEVDEDTAGDAPVRRAGSVHVELPPWPNPNSSSPAGADINRSFLGSEDSADAEFIRILELTDEERYRAENQSPGSGSEESADAVRPWRGSSVKRPVAHDSDVQRLHGKLTEALQLFGSMLD